MATYALGKHAMLLMGASGTAFASLVELDVRDVTLDDSKVDTVNLGTRNSTVNGRKNVNREVSVSFDILYNPEGVTEHTALRTAYEADADIAACVLSGALATTGSEGPWGEWSISKFSRDESRTDGIIYNVEMSLVTLTEWIDAGTLGTA